MKDVFARLKKRLLGKSKSEYPYIERKSVSSLTDKSILFKINNAIEEFRLVHWGGEKEYVMEIVESLNSHDVFLDIGSSVGLITVLASYRIKEGLVISVEPDPGNLRCLRDNLKLNSLKNNVIVDSAVGEAEGKLKLFTAGSNGLSPSLKQVNGIESYIEVRVETIDGLLAKDEIPLPTVIKIDIEGAEFMALKGMSRLLASNQKPRLIYLEIHPDFLSEFSTSETEILEYMETRSYHLEEKISRDNQLLCKFSR